MHPNQAFHTQDDAGNLAFAADRAFGVLCVNSAEGGPLVSHVPFLVDGADVWLHLVRSNPIARVLSAPQPAVIAVNGPDGYVSPDWYELPDQVPTWNYVAVHLRGTLERRAAEELRGVIDRQTAFFEQKLLPKTSWTSDKMTPEVLDKMMRAIVPCRMRIEHIDGTWKLNQNKPDAARLRAADRMATQGIGMALRELAARMRDA
ncbi:FMN-binding negative transcriptional regulator [Aliishimia ponticola]|uniref:FMN-binding negative transcriptional regulator n=1 Tax=Aliishimia ponticola TaxID=2499833 RepID=A0A4S4NFC1_9RHOB|nr:FMN-binding negative transcriptional regulator [Aliishimia ponticola]THH34770.1 FMN-binding negative transcriptional regulator [Aliishimia ponticola]